MPSANPSEESGPNILFPGKLLLFGEHILLLGATAIAAPVPALYGKWAWSVGGDPKSRHLMDFAQSAALLAIGTIDTNAFITDLESGLFFDSNIPIGYGLGSSGALCAAVYGRYATEKVTDPGELKQVFSHMESFFHGNSSGIDPLTSYLAKPIAVRQTTMVSQVDIPVRPDDPVVFLIDTGLPRQTGPLVKWFLEQSRDAEFSELLRQELLPAHEQMVASWIAGKPGVFWPLLHEISAFQFNHFAPMIPATLSDLWADSLKGRDFNLKLCGAGGGGYMIGFSRDASVPESLRKSFNIIMPFQTITP
jgi:mevalonate kinase